MAVPSIASISPSSGHTGGGQQLVEITGTGFQLWAIPPPSNRPAGDVRWPTVEVLFGGKPAPLVIVASATRLLVRPPVSPLEAAKPDHGEGAVDVVVRNIDEDGATIAGETVTLAGGYRYRRRQMSDETNLQRVVRALIHELKRQVIENVSITTHSDYDLDTTDMLDVVDVATIPALVIFGPIVQENRTYGYPGPILVKRTATESDVVAQATDDLFFTMICVSDSKAESLNLQAAVREFFVENSYLTVQRDSQDSSKGFVSYAIDLDQAGLAPVPSADQKSNLRSFSGSFVVRGFGSGSRVIGRTSIVTEEPSITSSKKDG